MTTITAQAATNGVQDLIDRIRGQGVQAAREESDRILGEARKEAAATKAKADADAKAMIESTRAQVATEKAAAAEAIKNAARDSILELRNDVRKAFEVHVRRLVSQQVQDTGFVRSLVLVLAGEAAEKHVNDKDASIFVSTAMGGAKGAEAANEQVQKKVNNAVLGAMGVMLREGIQLLTDDGIKGGARVKLSGENLEIDMTEEALSRLLLKNLLPRYRAIVQKEEGTA